MGEECEIVNSMVKVSFPEKVTFSPKSERGKEPSQVGRTFLPGRRNSRCKGPEVTDCRTAPGRAEGAANAE